MHVKSALIKQPGSNLATHGVQTNKPGGGANLNALGTTATAPLQQQQAAPPPIALQTATVMTGKSGRLHVVPQDGTTIRELADHFAATAAKNGGKELRFAQSPGYNEPTLHIHKGNISGFRKGDERAQKKDAAADQITGMIDRQLGRPGAGKALLNQLAADGAIKHTSPLKARDLATIANAVDGLARKDADAFAALDEAAPKVADLVRARAQVTANPPSQGARQAAMQAFNATPIPIGDDARFKALDGGAWGAVRVKGQAPDGSQVTFALKTEPPELHEKVRFVAGLFGEVAAEAARPLPLGFMKTQVLERGAAGDSELTKATQAKLLDEFDGMIARDEGRRDGMGGGPKSYKAVLTPGSDQYNGGLVTKSEWIDGSALRDFTATEKLGLIKSGLLAENLAHAAVLGPMFGLTDHAGLGNHGETGYTNLSNFRLGNDGTLKTIDFDTKYNSANSIGKSPKEILTAYEQLTTYLTELADDPDPVGRLEAGLPNAKGNVPKSATTPLTGVIKEVVRPDNHEATLLSPEDGQALGASYTQKDKVGFSAQLVLGSLDSLQYLKDELDTFEAAHQSQPASTFNGGQFFGALRQLLDDADLPALRAKLGASLDQVKPPPFE